MHQNQAHDVFSIKFENMDVIKIPGANATTKTKIIRKRKTSPPLLFLSLSSWISYRFPVSLSYIYFPIFKL